MAGEEEEKEELVNSNDETDIFQESNGKRKWNRKDS